MNPLGPLADARDSVRAGAVPRRQELELLLRTDGEGGPPADSDKSHGRAARGGRDETLSERTVCPIAQSDGGEVWSLAGNRADAERIAVQYRRAEFASRWFNYSVGFV